MSKIEKDIENWYNRLAINNDVSINEAKKLLSEKELKEFTWSIAEYIEKGKNNINGQWAKQLENSSAMVHISRLDSLKIQIRAELEQLYFKLDKNLATHLNSQYLDKFYKTAYEVQKGTGVGFNILRLDANTIENTLKNGWALDGKNFSDRIWEDKNKLLYKLQTDVVTSTITGDNINTLTNKISKDLNVKKSNVARLVRTESAYISSLAEHESFKELEVYEYEILATLDNRTSDRCQNLDGAVFKLSDYEIGTTAPPFHPNCRSTTVPYFDDFKEGTRFVRDKKVEAIYIDRNIKYDELFDTFVN